MFVILVYDINQKRVAKVLKLCRSYLHWVQNSVFEGDITDASLFQLKSRLSAIIDEAEDSVIFYTFSSKQYSSFEVLGLQKGGATQFL